MTKAQRRRAQEEIMLALANRLHVMRQQPNADPVQVRAFLEETWRVGKLFGFTTAFGIGPIN